MKDIEQIIARREEDIRNFIRWKYSDNECLELIAIYSSSIKETLEGVKQKISKLKNIDTMTDYDVGYNDCKSDTINYLDSIINKLK